ncbi:MAG: hypothetical protein AAF850_09805 [Pseudomonadota bacterium]
MKILKLIILLLGALPLVSIIGPQQAFAQSEQDAGPTDEIVVFGAREGPRFWRVKSGDGEAFVLPTTRFTPEDFEWSDRQLKFLLEETTLLIAPTQAEASAGARARMVGAALRTITINRGRLFMPKGVTLADRVGADLAGAFALSSARVEARARAKRAARRDKSSAEGNEVDRQETPEPAEDAIAKAIENADPSRFHPIFQSGGLIGDAVDAAGLESFEDSAEKHIRKLARKAKVETKPVAAFQLAFADMRSFLQSAQDFSEDTNRACIQASIDFAEDGIVEAATRARDWARGNVESLIASADETTFDGCALAISNELGGLQTLGGANLAAVDLVSPWMVAIEDALDGGGVTLALVPFEVFLKTGGVRERLIARGSEVIDP